MAVRFDTTGPGGTDNASSGTITLTWTHTPLDYSNLAVVVGVVVGKNGTAVPSATYAGISMEVLGFADINGAGSVYFFGILAPPPGSKTVVVSYTVSGSTGMAANSASYTGVGAFGDSVATTSSTASLTIATPVDGMSAIIIGGSSSNITSFNKTTRYENDTNQIFVLWATLGGDDNVPGSTTYTWSGGSGTRGVAAQLLPAMPFYQMF